MNAQHHASHPFALMMNPQEVLQAIEESERLQHLQRRVCRPLDKPLIPHVLSELELFDNSIDDSSLDSVLGDQLDDDEDDVGHICG